MKRRQAIKLMAVVGGGALAGFGGYKAYHIFKTPDIAFLESNIPMLDALAETIIPQTTTPGAREAGVGSFLALNVKNTLDTRSQNNFIDGMKDINQYCRRKFDKVFAECGPEQQYSAIHHTKESEFKLNGKYGKAQKKYLGATFFETLKEFTVYGYCTSKVGAQQGLAYDYIPMAYKGCIPLKPGQRSWALK